VKDKMSERNKPIQDINIENPVQETVVPMTEADMKTLMQAYREAHPEEFAGTPAWQIKVTAENAAKVYDETGILFHISVG
jgi:hypothetical protein